MSDRVRPWYCSHLRQALLGLDNGAVVDAVRVINQKAVASRVRLLWLLRRRFWEYGRDQGRRLGGILLAVNAEERAGICAHDLGCIDAGGLRMDDHIVSGLEGISSIFLPEKVAVLHGTSYNIKVVID